MIKNEEQLERLKMKPRMGRDEIALRLSLQLGQTPESSLEALDTLTNIIQESLKSGRNVCIHGFGTFQAIKLEAGKVRNPRVAKGPLAFKVVGPRVRYRWKPGASF